MMFELLNGTVRLGEWTVFNGLNLTVEDGEIVSILDPAVAGKPPYSGLAVALNVLNRATAASVQPASSRHHRPRNHDAVSATCVVPPPERRPKHRFGGGEHRSQEDVIIAG